MWEDFSDCLDLNFEAQYCAGAWISISGFRLNALNEIAARGLEDSRKMRTIVQSLGFYLGLINLI